jgi:hypothetical protein
MLHVPVPRSTFQFDPTKERTAIDHLCHPDDLIIIAKLHKPRIFILKWLPINSNALRVGTKCSAPGSLDDKPWLLELHMTSSATMPERPARFRPPCKLLDDGLVPQKELERFTLCESSLSE